MTRNPGPLQAVEALFVRQVGPFWLGTVGDESHDSGYHRGGTEVPFGDYSTLHPRDVAGIQRFGGNWASAVDIGMGWPASRSWFVWLLGECRAGRMPDVAEVIGSADGVQDFRYTADDGFQSGEWWFRDHVLHTHISFFRDSIFRSHLYLFDRWTASGRTAKVAVPTAGPPSVPTPVPGTFPAAGNPSQEGFVFAPYLAAAIILAWMIRRRREAGL